MKLKGKSYWTIKPDGNANDINTDYIISGRYKFKTEDIRELGKHIFEDIEPNFAQKIRKGDLVIAGKNFGCGSSREQAPLALIAAGVGAVVAQSFARIFYRNAFNNGLPLIEYDTSGIKENDEVEIDLEKGVLKNLTQNTETKISPLPKVMIKLLNDSGLIEHFKKYGGFNL